MEVYAVNAGAEEVLSLEWVFFAGNWQEEKNLIFLITTFLKIPHPNAHLMIVGNGPLEAQAKKAAGEIAVYFLFNDFCS